MLAELASRFWTTIQNLDTISPQFVAGEHLRLHKAFWTGF